MGTDGSVRVTRVGRAALRRSFSRSPLQRRWASIDRATLSPARILGQGPVPTNRTPSQTCSTRSTPKIVQALSTAAALGLDRSRHPFPLSVTRTRPPAQPSLFPYTTLFRSVIAAEHLSQRRCR